MVATYSEGWSVAQRVWSGGDWQDFCMLLLRKRYMHHQLQEMPDKDKGDLGIEGFSLDGCAYQCYAAEEPLTVSERYERQRDKLTQDLGKLKKNESQLEKCFGTLIISRYVFMVPTFDSRRLVAFSSTKASEVRAWGLSFVSGDFTVVVVTDEAFAQEREKIIAIPDGFLSSLPPNAAVIDAWKTSNTTIVQNASRKLGAVGVHGAALDGALDSVVEQYLDGENALAALRDKYPDNWAAVNRLKSKKESLLAIEFPATLNTSISVLRQLVENLQREILVGTPAVSEPVASAIAWAAVADWLMRCPLDLIAP